MRLREAIMAGAALLSPAAMAEAQNFNQFVGFGASTLDTGWFANASTGFPDLDFWIASSLAAGGNAHWTGPGPGNAQILAGYFGLTANPANTANGTNFAVGGALDHLAPRKAISSPVSRSCPKLSPVQAKRNEHEENGGRFYRSAPERPS